MPGPLVYVLEVESEGLVASARLNEIEVFYEGDGRRRLAQSKVNPSIVEGRNVIEVWLGPVIDEDGNWLPLEQKFRLALVRGELGADPGPAGRVVEWQWDAAEAPLDELAMLPVWSVALAVDQAYGRWTWQDAPTAPFDDVDAAAIRARLEELHAALTARDAAAVARLVARRTEELGRALDVPVGEIEEGQAEHLASFFSEPGFELEPLDPELELRPMAGERLVAATGPGGIPPLRGAAGDRRFALGATLTREGGAWVIVR